MDGIMEVDTVLQHVRQAARRLHLSTDAAITQQILLLGDAYYGYRFTTADFTAIWSAADQTIKMYDRNSRPLGVFAVAKYPETSIAMPPLERKAA